MTNHSKDLTESIWETRFSKPFKISSTLASSLNFTTTKCLNPEVAINFLLLCKLHTLPYTYVDASYIEVEIIPMYVCTCEHIRVNVHVCVRLCACVWTIMLFAMLYFNVQSSVCFWHFLLWLFVSEFKHFSFLIFICFSTGIWQLACFVRL